MHIEIGIGLNNKKATMLNLLYTVLLFGWIYLMAQAAGGKISPALFVLATLGIFGLCWTLARHEQGAESSNGWGTKLYGHRRSANGHITTKWITILYLPLIPVRSYEVLREEQGRSLNLLVYSSDSSRLAVVPLPGLGLCWPQVSLLLRWRGEVSRRLFFWFGIFCGRAMFDAPLYIHDMNAPAALIETAFLSNRGDAKLLTERPGDFALAITDAAERYFESPDQ